MCWISDLDKKQSNFKHTVQLRWNCDCVQMNKCKLVAVLSMKARWCGKYEPSWVHYSYNIRGCQTWPLEKPDCKNFWPILDNSKTEQKPLSSSITHMNLSIPESSVEVCRWCYSSLGKSHLKATDKLTAWFKGLLTELHSAWVIAL